MTNLEDNIGRPAARDLRFSQDRLLLIRGSIWMLLGRLAFGAGAVLQNVVLARLLGPDEFGVVLLTQSLLLPASLIAVGGLDLLALRELRPPSHDPAAARGPSPASFTIIGALLIAGVGLAVFLCLAGGLWLGCGTLFKALQCHTVAEITPVLWPLITLAALQLFAAGVLRSLNRVLEAAFLASVLATYILLAGTALALISKTDLTIQNVLIIQAFGMAAGVGFSLRSVSRVGLIGRGDRASVSHMATSGPALMLTQLLALLVAQSDVLVAGFHSSPEAVAQYGVAARLAQLVSLPHLVLNGVLPPMIASALSEGRHRQIERIVQVGVALASTPALVLGLGFMFLGREVLSLGFGAFYGSAATILAILAAGNIVNVFCGPCSQALIMAGHERTLNLITAVNCVFCIGVGALASLWFGIVGLASVYALGLSLQGIAGVYATYKLVGIRTFAASPVTVVNAIRS